MAAIDAHFEISRKHARRLLRDAQRPIQVHASTVAAAAFALFCASVVGGYLLRAWQFQ
jgi:hypothetical protein